MADNLVGSAYVVIRAVTEGVERQIKDGVTKGIKNSQNDSAVKNESEKLGTNIGDKVSEGTDNEIKKSLGTRFRNTFRSLFQAVTKNRDGENFGHQLGTAIGKGLTAGGGIPMKALLAPLLSPVIAGALKILNAGLSSVVSVAAKLGPAIVTGGVAAIGTYAALGQGLLALKLAFTAQTPILARFKKALHDAGADGSQVIAELQRKLLPGLAGPLINIQRNLEGVFHAFTDVGGVIDGIAAKFAVLTANPIFKANLLGVVKANNIILTNFGDALVHIADAAFVLLKVISPLTIEFSNFVKQIAASADASARAGQESGKLFAFFERGADTIKQLVRIAGNIKDAFSSIFTAAAPAGQTFLDAIENITIRFKTFMEVAKDNGTLKQFFDSAIPVMHEFSALFAAIFKALTANIAGNTGGTIAFLQDLRLKVLPALIPLVQQLNTAGPALSNLLTNFAKLLTNLSKSGGLGTFVATLSTMVNVFATLAATPVVGQLLGIGVGLAGISKALSFIPGFEKLTGLIGEKAWDAFGPKIEAIGTSLAGKLGAGIEAASKGISGLATKVIGTVAPLLVSAFGAIATAAEAAWVAITGPVGLIVIAILAVIAVIVVLYLKFKPFHDLVNAVASAIRDFLITAFEDFIGIVKAVWAILEPVGKFVGIVLVEYFKIWFTVVSTYLKIVATILYDVFAVATTLIITFFTVWSNIWKAVYNVVVDAFTKYILPILKIFIAFYKAEFELVLAIAKAVWNTVSSIVGAVMRAISGFVQARIQEIKNLFQSLVGFIAGVWHTISGAVGTLLHPIVNAWQTVHDQVTRIWSGFSRFMSGIFGGIGGVVASAFDGVKGFINSDIIDPINRVISGFNKLPGPDISEVPRLAKGGVVAASPGGTLAVIAEAGRPERVEPLDADGLSKRDRALIGALSGGSARAYTFDVKTERTWTPQEALALIAQAETLYGG